MKLYNNYQHRNEHPADVHYKMRQRKKAIAPQKLLWTSSRTNATSRGLPHSIAESDIYIPPRCKYLGHKLSWTDQRSEVTPSIDRIDPTKGYIKGNIQVISWEANQLKSDMTPADWDSFMEFWRAENEYEEAVNDGVY